MAEKHVRVVLDMHEDGETLHKSPLHFKCNCLLCVSLLCCSFWGVYTALSLEDLTAGIQKINDCLGELVASNERVKYSRRIYP